MKRAAITLIILAFVSEAYSQKETSRLNIGLGLNYTSYMFRADVKPSIHLGIGYDFSNRVGVYGSFTSHKSIKGTPADKTFVLSLHALPRLVGTYKSKFSWYFPAGVSLVSMKDYYSGEQLQQIGFTVNIGTGVQYRINKLSLFSDFNVGFATSEYKRKVLLSGYDYLSLNTGVKIPIGKLE